MPILLPIPTFAYTVAQRHAVRATLANKLKKYIQLYGGSRSGKTALVINLLIMMCFKYPGSKHIVIRHSFANAKKTVWKQTIEPMVKHYARHKLCSINKTQGSIDFNNGSSIVLGGLQSDQIDSILGSEYATIYVNEANENRWTDIELLFSRLNDTSVDKDGNMIKCRFIADCNPTSFNSWDYKFFHLGINPADGAPHKEREKIERIKLNPYDNKENLNQEYLTTLESLSETKKKRFFFGEYGNYSGLIYNLPPAQRSIDFTIPRFGTCIGGLDFGFVHPCAFSVLKTDGENWIQTDEFYKTKMTSPRIREKARELHNKHHFEVLYCDGARKEIIQELKEDGIPAEPAIKGPGSVLSGISYVGGLIEDGKFHINGDKCPMTLAEFDSYIWEEEKDKPKKIDDDAMDSVRYAIYSYVLNSGLYAKADDLSDFQSHL
jgi:phage terminase large subunit